MTTNMGQDGSVPGAPHHGAPHHGTASGPEPAVVLSAAAPAGARAEPYGPADGGAMAGAVAAKLLAGWLANRRQTLMPHTLNFRALAAPEVDLLIRTMAAAAQADGVPGEAERRQAALALALVGADQAEVERHAAALDVPQPVSQLVAAVRDARINAHAYASALLAIDRTTPVGHAFLGYVAAGLSLPPDLARALESRYRV